MIVLDANVLIAFLDATDAHHAAALSLLDSRAHGGFATSALQDVLGAARVWADNRCRMPDAGCRMPDAARRAGVEVVSSRSGVGDTG